MGTAGVGGRRDGLAAVDPLASGPTVHCANPSSTQVPPFTLAPTRERAGVTGQG